MTYSHIGKGGARTRIPFIVQDGIRHYQRHAIELRDDVLTVTGEILPAGTKASVLSGGGYNGRMAAGLALWDGSGRHLHVYTARV